MTKLTDISLGTLDAAVCAAEPNPNCLYAPRKGLPVLRQLIGQRFGIAPDQVVIVAGASMALSCCFLALPADRCVLLPRPGFPAYTGAARLLRRPFVHYDLGLGWLKSLRDALELHRPGALLLNSPGNPMGNVVGDEYRSQVLELAAKLGTIVILDETYAGLEFAGSGSSGALIGEQPYVIRIGSFSKRFAAPGLRVGYVIANTAMADRITHINWVLAMSPGSSNQVTAAELMMNELRSPDRSKRIAMQLHASCKTALSALARHGITAAEPQGGPLLWITMPDACGTGSDVAMHCRKEAGILVSPGEAFGHEGSPTIRCCFALQPDQVDPVFDRLGAALTHYFETTGNLSYMGTHSQ